jgi:MYXO-CTERM domain-containing protein
VIAFAAMIASTFSMPAFGAVFTLGPGSTGHFSGDLTISFEVNSIPFSSTGNFVGQSSSPPEGLDTTLSGFLNASSDGFTLTFPGGGAMSAAPSGNWMPSGAPAAFGFMVNVSFPGGVSFQMVGSLRNLSFDVTGSTALSGPIGNQSFSTTGLGLTMLTGTLDATVTACTPACGTPEPLTVDVSDPLPDPLVLGTGTLTTAGGLHTLNLPIGISISESQTVTDPDTGIPVTVALDLRADGSVTAMTPVPEPDSWPSLLAGLGGLALAARSRRRRR